jgi:hypothetical protein
MYQLRIVVYVAKVNAVLKEKTTTLIWQDYPESEGIKLRLYIAYSRMSSHTQCSLLASRQKN